MLKLPITMQLLPSVPAKKAKQGLSDSDPYDLPYISPGTINSLAAAPADSTQAAPVLPSRIQEVLARLRQSGIPTAIAK
jgi:hypothetical protein